MGVNLAHTHWSKGQQWQVSAGGKPAAAINSIISSTLSSTEITIGGHPTKKNVGFTQKLAVLPSKGQLPQELLPVSNLSLCFGVRAVPSCFQQWGPDVAVDPGSGNAELCQTWKQWGN